MDLEQSEGESKFWNTPELVKKLVSLLDPVSTLGLVQSEMLNKQILQKILSPAAWNQLIRHSSSYSGGLLKKERFEGRCNNFEADQLGGSQHVSATSAGCHLPVLSRHKCGGDLHMPGKPPYYATMHMLLCICSVHFFLLLEEVESAFGTAEHKVDFNC